MLRLALFISSVVIISSCSCKKWLTATDEADLNLHIEQLVFDYQKQWFIINDNSLYIKEGKLDKSGTYKMRIKYSKRLKVEEIIELRKLTQNIVNLKENKFSNKKVIGSAHWKISIFLNSQIKDVSLSNAMPPETWALFDYINSLIPRNKKHLYHREFQFLYE